MIPSLIDFINKSPTAWHAVAVQSEILEKQGFKRLNEEQKWTLKAGEKYFVQRNGSSLIAFIVPEKTVARVHLAASHTDSPALKLKPLAPYYREGMALIGVDIYGSPLLNSWLNRELGIAGKVIYEDIKGRFVEALVDIKDAPFVIPQLAIHLDRDINTQGLLLNKQDHIAALAALNIQSDEEAQRYLYSLFDKHFKHKSIIAHDLYLYPLEEPKLLGPKGQMIAAYRLDSLASVHSIMEAIVKVKKSPKNTLLMSVTWDNEEIGSETPQGAASPFFSHVMERIAIALKLSREDYLRMLPSSLCLSVDLAQGINPNYLEKHEPRHRAALGKGLVIKYSTQQRYATTCGTAAVVTALCKSKKIPFQHIISRADLPSGTTIGPIHATRTGMPTIDIGIPQLSMHSARELAACSDQEAMIELLTAFYNTEQ